MWGCWISELAYALAVAALALGERARSLELLDQAVKSGWRDAGWLRKDPLLAALSDDPAFIAVVARAGAGPPVRFAGPAGPTGAAGPAGPTGPPGPTSGKAIA